MTQVNTKKEKSDHPNSMVDFNDALLELQAHIHEEPMPTMEVDPKFFLALCKGRVQESITYGNPGVRVFPAGKMDDVLDAENVTAEKYHEREIRRISAEANK